MIHDLPDCTLVRVEIRLIIPTANAPANANWNNRVSHTEREPDPETIVRLRMINIELHVITATGGQSTPVPWINVIANARFGFQVGSDGGGYTWSRNSRAIRASAFR